MNLRRTWTAFALIFVLVGVQDATAQETIGSFTYAQLSEGGADRSSIASFGYNYEGGLVWKCEANGLNVFFILPQALGDGGSEITIEYGFGGAAPANGQSWQYSADDLLATMPQGSVAAFTTAARSASTITVRATDPGSGSSASYEIPLQQLGSALERLSCAS